MNTGSTFKKFDYSNVDKNVTEIESIIKNANKTIDSCNDIMTVIGKDEKVWTGSLANAISADWKKSKEQFDSFVNEFRRLINQKYEQAGEEHRKFEND